MRILFLLAVTACSDPAEPIPIDDASIDVATSIDVDAEAEPDVRDAAFADTASAVDPCKKHLTVLFAVGTGTSALKSHAGACWSVLDADGSANKSFRKCSTGTWTVTNASAPNWAFDDTNPNAALSQDEDFLKTCASGATGDGFEYMAYRGSWRLLFPATHLRAFFAELYAGDGDVDDYWPSKYVSDAQLAKHTVYPMINIGPTNVASPAGAIKTDGLAMCKTIEDGGYFGVYVGTWDQPMSDSDPRITALASALDTCTKK
ncbi:MAG TPA: hypothetical protein VGH87_07195 [Polyangiaceae bacterium]|nr:hypothetical protein [Polyangiaceae bacterium]